MFDLVSELAKKDKIIELKMCQVLLENNNYYPWVILVPQIDGLKNMLPLSMEQRIQLMREMALCEEVLAENFQCDQTNVVAAANERSQFCIDVIARRKKDKDWPNFVCTSKSYKDDEKKEVINKIEKAMRIKMADAKYMQF